ncbi:hypothetical protein F5Y14DRAFT_386270 [Nemania sp. NC0429]|nr:hypothetical protein F5Y14DRAFT_386270 [Nemania sp. NC0429]
MLRRSVLGAVGAGNGASAFEAAARRMAGQQQRSFTCTAPRSASIVHFTPSSSPQLDSLLDTIRTKIILPYYLPLYQRQRLYKPNWEKKLASDPIIIEIDGEVIKFRYQNPAKDLPNTHKSVVRAIELFKTADDFANLKPLLEGLAYTGRNIPPAVYHKILRRTCDKGYVYHIIDCARSVRHTGFKLDSSEKVNELLHFVQMKARDADWDESETRQALRWTEVILEMLHKEEHQPKRPHDGSTIANQWPLSRDPMVLMASLHLAAVLAARHAAGEGVPKMVHKLARDIVTLWPEDKSLREVYPSELYTDVYQMGYLNEPNKFITLATPLLHGLDTAITAVEAPHPELAPKLRTRRDLLATEIETARKQLAEEVTRAQEASAEPSAEKGKRRQKVKPLEAKRGEKIYRKFYDA